MTMLGLNCVIFKVQFCKGVIGKWSFSYDTLQGTKFHSSACNYK